MHVSISHVPKRASLPDDLPKKLKKNIKETPVFKSIYAWREERERREEKYHVTLCGDQCPGREPQGSVCSTSSGSSEQSWDLEQNRTGRPLQTDGPSRDFRSEKKIACAYTHTRIYMAHSFQGNFYMLYLSSACAGPCSSISTENTTDA